MGMKYDFCGYATKNDVRCSDGRTIRHGAFEMNDGQIVPLVWQHLHDDPRNVLGHALLEQRSDGMYAYGIFNDTEDGMRAKKLVKHGDIRSMSIYANKLIHKGSDVIHGEIKEVSLVLAGANPEAIIEYLDMEHAEDGTGTEAVIDEAVELEDTLSGEVQKSEPEVEEEPVQEQVIEHADKEEKPMAEANEKTVQDVFDAMSEEQKNVVYYMLSQVASGKGGEMAQSDEEGEDFMKYNVFEGTQNEGQVLSHSDMKAFEQAVFADAKKHGSLKESILAHAGDYGIDNIEYLFPDARTISDQPDFIKRRTEWVNSVIDGAKHSPFSRIKTIHADITADEARAKGYITGKLKKEEVFTLLKRSTTPTTIYKKQKLDRDDILDITDFDVTMYVKGEMRIMLDEEIARAVLIGDGRLPSSDDKIPEDHIRPIWKENELYAMHYTCTANDASAFIDEVVTAMTDYEGSGQPVMFAPQPIITACLLLKDGDGYRMYKTMAELATALQVSKVIPVEVMKNQTRELDGHTMKLDAIVLNMKDYVLGADKGGQVTAFEDFDIDYNQEKYLLETRCSGALVKPKSALVFEHQTA